jgi:hypothetical protein
MRNLNLNKSFNHGYAGSIGLAFLSVVLILGCKGGDNEVTALRLPDTVNVTVNRPLGSGSATVPTQSRDKQKTGKVQNDKSKSTGKAQIPDGSGTSLPMGTLPAGGVKWWDHRTIFFVDYIGGSGSFVYESVKGQRYFPETKIFVYSTNTSMEGTTQYAKIKSTFEATELDDRIFIWVHLDDKNKPISKKVLASDNIKDKLDRAPLKIE